MVIYTYTTSDEYEFPIYEAKSLAELARKVGVSKATVTTAIRRVEKNPGAKSRYHRIIIDED